jgi:hypothetical protein
MDHTHTWGRTYWGGALFCFVADVEIRKQTKNKKGLEDALRGILEAGGDIRDDWEIEKAFQIGDRATGVGVLAKLYSEWKANPVLVDMTGFWGSLGVEVRDGKVVLRDDASGSAIRRAIEQGTPDAKAGDQASPSGEGTEKDWAAASRPLAVFAGRTTKSN